METPQTLTIPRAGHAALTARLYPGAPGRQAVLYAHLSGEDEAAAVKAAGGAALCAISGEDWNADLSPWPAPRAFPQGEDFLGGAAEYLAFFCDTMLPAAEGALGLSTPRRGMAGYSLAGLFGIYALYSSDKFDILASMSGSLWFDGFAAFLAARAPRAAPRYAYFSLGDREPRSRDARLAAVGPATEAARARLAALGAETDFVWEAGGHFADIPGRCARGIAAAAARL